MTEEKIFMQQGGVTVTSTRFSIGRKSYGMTNISSISVKRKTRSQVGPILLIGIGCDPVVLLSQCGTVLVGLAPNGEYWSGQCFVGECRRIHRVEYFIPFQRDHLAVAVAGPICDLSGHNLRNSQSIVRSERPFCRTDRSSTGRGDRVQRLKHIRPGLWKPGRTFCSEWCYLGRRLSPGQAIRRVIE